MKSDLIREAICANVARLLKEERNKRGLSLNAVAQASGLSRQMISFVETAERRPTLDTLLRITTVFEIDVEKLIEKARRDTLRTFGK